jgi:UDPglucose 6-dehydrogenase
MRIAVIGSGYVGLVAAACFVEIGHEVVCVDVDDAKIQALKDGKTPIHEHLLPELLDRHRGGRLTFSTSVADSARASDVIFITVGTPQSATGEADLSYVEAVTHQIAAVVEGRKLIVEKSTVPVRTCESIRKTMLLSGARPNAFSIASNPEFLREGSAVTDFLYPDRIVVGVDDEFSALMLQEIYSPLTSGEYYRRADAIRVEGSAGYKQAPIIVTSAKSAELIKHASNAFLAMKISFINAVANISELVGANIDDVCAGMGSDSRIGSKFLKAGIGYGGSCFPKDVQAFSAVATQCGYEFQLLKQVIAINNNQRQQFLKKVRDAVWTLRGKQIAVLGAAFKGGTDDIRESPAIAIIRDLLGDGAKIRLYDPAAMPNAKQILGNEVEYATDVYDAVRGSDALLILTEWDEFANLDLKRLRAALRFPIVIDGRNLYDPRRMAKAGLMYSSVGRPEIMPERSGKPEKKSGVGERRSDISPTASAD